MLVRRSVAASMALSISMVVTSCAGQIATAPASATMQSTPSPIPAASPKGTPRTLTFEITPIGNSTVHGSVQIDDAVGSYVLTVNIEGLTPSSTHLINMHGGTCASIDVTIQIAVAQGVKADASGTATFSATYHNAYRIPTGGRVLTVHGNEPTGNIYHVACAELTA